MRKIMGKLTRKLMRKIAQNLTRPRAATLIP